MNKIVVFLILIVFGTAGIYVSIVYGSRNSAPNLECTSCHEGVMFQDMVKIQGLPKSYVPGKTYNLTLVLKSDLESMSESKGGFAVQVSAGKLIATDKKNTQVIDTTLTHTQEGSESRKWTFGWKAPTQKTEDANIMVMAVAANGDYSSAGDELSAGSYTIKPAK